MKLCLACLLLLCTQISYGYEYTLQFSAAGASGLIVAGYEFVDGTVVGNCSYHISTSGSGRGGHGSTTYYYNDCTWDLYGNLLSKLPVSTPMAPPPPLSQTGTETVYAVEGNSSTGSDSRGFGFVSTSSSHYSWMSNGGYAVIPDSLYLVTATLVSDGDLPLAFGTPIVSPAVSGLYTPTPVTATIASTNCPSSVAVGASCSITVSYNPRTIKCTGSPYGYGYTNITLRLVSDAVSSSPFTEGFTITGMRFCDDN